MYSSGLYPRRSSSARLASRMRPSGPILLMPTTASSRKSHNSHWLRRNSTETLTRSTIRRRFFRATHTSMCAWFLLPSLRELLEETVDLLREDVEFLKVPMDPRPPQIAEPRSALPGLLDLPEATVGLPQVIVDLPKILFDPLQ